MKKHLSLLLIVLTPILDLAQNTLIIKNVGVIDVKAGKINKNKTVIISGNRIVSVNNRTTVSQNANIVDGKGKFLIPGLWDMHAHTLTDRRYVYSFPMLIANGVTGVREMGNNLPMEEVNQIRKNVASGKMLGPRFGALTYHILDGDGSQLGPATIVSSPDSARAIVKKYKENGADFIKPYNLLSREVYLAIIDEARRQHLPVEGHVPFSLTAAEVSDLGQKTIEHNFDILLSCSKNENELRKDLRQQTWGQIEAKAAVSYDEQKAKKLFLRLPHNKTWSCPTIIFYKPVWLIGDENEALQDTLLKYLPKAEVEGWHNAFQKLSHNTVEEYTKIQYQMRSRIVKEMHQAGIGILAGTDAGAIFSIPGFNVHHELQALVDAGLSNIEALRAATLNPAKFLGREKDLGSVEQGKIADLVLLDANPLENISNTKTIYAVIVNGKLLQRNDLDALLNQIKESVKR